MPAAFPLPQFDDVLEAAARIAPHASVTPLLRADALDAAAGCALLFKAEPLQRGGAFKFRGACNAVFSLGAEDAARGVVTHSSGNHGAALALAARLRGIPCHVVVPDGAVATKLSRIAGFGAVLHRCDATLEAREATCASVQEATGAVLVHPYADARVIAGQGTAALELLRETGPLDAIVTPVGGGGLAGGSAIAAHGIDAAIEMHGAEPEGADDAARSLREGVRITELAPDTICDGLRGLLGAINFDLLREHRVQVTTVADRDTLAAMRLIWTRLKIVVEPSSAIALAAVFARRERFAGRRIGIVLSGGNVDVDDYFGRLA